MECEDILRVLDRSSIAGNDRSSTAGRYIISKEAKQRRNEKTKQENLVIAENVAEEESLVPLRKGSRSKDAKVKQTDGLREEEYDFVPEIITEASASGEVKETYTREGVCLGTGGFAKVYKVRESSTSQVFADKVICTEIFKRKSNSREKVDREINIHRQLDHENVVKFVKWFVDGNFLHMIMEICYNRTLLHVIRLRKTITEPEARYYVKQIMDGTRYLHLRKVLHRDLKLGNMFLQRDMTVKIGDFGLASTFSGMSKSAGSVCGTPNYIAPEVLSKKGHGVTSDIWAIGCMLFAMLCGYPPFETETINDTYRKITNGSFTFPKHNQVSTPASDLIQMMLSPQPEKRGHLALVDRDDADNLYLHSFFKEFTPNTLPSRAVRTIPDLDKERSACLESTHNRSSAVSISGRRMTNEDPGCASFSPIFSPSLLKQKFDSFFDSKRSTFKQRVVRMLEMILEGGAQVRQTSPPVKHSHLPLFVTKWVDYSNKFGFGYQLSNNAIGLLFNDSTKLGCSGDRKTIEFSDQKGKNFTFARDGRLSNQELRVRVTILESMVNYMETNLNDAGASLQGMPLNITQAQKSVIPQLKHWCRSQEELVMEFNNNTIQINNLNKHSKMIVFEVGQELYLTLIYPSRIVATYAVTSLLGGVAPSLLLCWVETSLPALRTLAEWD